MEYNFTYTEDKVPSEIFLILNDVTTAPAPSLWHKSGVDLITRCEVWGVRCGHDLTVWGPPSPHASRWQPDWTWYVALTSHVTRLAVGPHWNINNQQWRESADCWLLMCWWSNNYKSRQWEIKSNCSEGNAMQCNVKHLEWPEDRITSQLHINNLK